MAAGQRRADGGLALAVYVAVGSIEVGEAPLQEQVGHLAELGDVHLAVFQHGQTHASKAEFFHDDVTS